MENDIRIAVAENHSILRNTMVRMLNGEEGIHAAIEAGNGKDLLDQLTNTQVDVIILDLDMPVMDGKEAHYNIRRKYSHIKVLILSMHLTKLHVEKYISNGANGYLSKDIDYDDLVKAINKVHKSAYYFDENVTPELIEEIALNTIRKVKFLENDQLSNREIQVLAMICAQKSSPEIAKEIKISCRTVESHRNNIMKKAGVKNGLGLMEYAIKKGYYEMDF
ncbi:MAG: DNA-binding NarL/FixJ family response regulator [Crocinitomicaceae bacterium]|jgi:DNA-binding NarL/FixJ family response regulator